MNYCPAVARRALDQYRAPRPTEGRAGQQTLGQRSAEGLLVIARGMSEGTNERERPERIGWGGCGPRCGCG
ncbi:hypothetical protein [Haladaptatus sp. CMAA 1911]|uniref:hypothetical protein n=1 Tax=unclassified Haladaptatus TaxID=2622732 RepID=UPI003754C598